MEYRVMYMTRSGYEKISASMDYHKAIEFANKKNTYCELLKIEDLGYNF